MSYQFQGQVALPNGAIIDASDPTVAAWAVYAAEIGIPPGAFQALTETALRQLAAGDTPDLSDYGGLRNWVGQLRETAVKDFGLSDDMADEGATLMFTDLVAHSEIAIPDSVPDEERAVIEDARAEFAAAREAFAKEHPETDEVAAPEPGDHLARGHDGSLRPDASGDIAQAGASKPPSLSAVRDLERRQAELMTRLNDGDEMAEMELNKLMSEWETVVGDAPAGSSIPEGHMSIDDAEG